MSIEITPDRQECYADGELTNGLVPSITMYGTVSVLAPDGMWDWEIKYDGNIIAVGTAAANDYGSFNWTISNAAPGMRPEFDGSATRATGGTASGLGVGQVPHLCRDRRSRGTRDRARDRARSRSRTTTPARRRGDGGNYVPPE
jgi:hypothetical protein